MTDPLAKRVEALYLAAERCDPAEVAQFLAERAVDDPSAVAEVRAMLDVPEQELRRVFVEPDYKEAVGESAGDHLGPYKLLEQLGEGGFGIVWRAEQARPVRRTVAIKILKAGMDTKQVLARFEAERNALSLMNHASIARVLDAGATRTGRPFFAMELVEGIPITDFCDQEELPIERRLALFLDICAAVQHAHQKGVIHRDLKPANILVTMHDGQPVPKVIDFGIAKATGQSLADGTLFTQQGQLMGTPEYMSPEQAEMSGIGVDSTTDIYALGVLLYELLTGVLPFDPETLRSRGFAEIHRVLREEEPQKPSTRVSTLGADTKTIGKRRGIDPRKLRSELSGDLDWIVLRAMEKQRTRRYPSASELAADVRRHLEDEPVLAGPPSASYRLRKFVKRNRKSVVFAATTLLLLVGGIAATTRGMLLAERARAEAEVARADAVAAQGVADTERAEAQAQRAEAVAQRGEAEAQTARAEVSRALASSETARARAVTDFLLDTLGLADPDVTELPEMTMADVLDEAAAQVGETFRHYPKSEAEVRLVLGRAYFTLGRPDLANVHLRRALFLHRSVLESDTHLICDVMRVLWQVSMRLFDDDWMVLALETRDLNLELLERTHPELTEGFRNLNARIFRPVVDEAEIREEWEALLALGWERVQPGEPAYGYLSMAADSVPMALGQRSRTTVAAEMVEYLLAKSTAPLTNARLRFLTENALHFRIRAGDFEGARTLLGERVASLTEKLGPEHWYLQIYRYFEATCLIDEGRVDEAQVLLEGSLAALESSPAPNIWTAWSVRQALARLHEAAGRPDLAAPHRQALLERMLATPIPTVWVLVRDFLSPVNQELIDAIDEFDIALKRCARRDPMRSKCAEELAALGATLIESRRRIAPIGGAAASVVLPQLAFLGESLLASPTTSATGEALLAEAHDSSNPYRSNRLLAACLLRDYFVRSGRESDASRLAQDVSAIVAEVLAGGPVWSWHSEVHLNEMAWLLLRTPGLDPGAYPLIAEFVLANLGAAPAIPEHANTLGVALYRAGRHGEAVEQLLRSRELCLATGDESAQPADLAFLALAQHKLGHTQEAQASMEQLRLAVQEMGSAASAETLTLLAEAQAQLGSND